MQVGFLVRLTRLTLCSGETKRPLALAAAFLPLLAMVSHGFAQNWAQTSAPSGLWSGVASSADGSKLVAAARFTDTGFNPSGIYVSTNSGRIWQLTSAPIQ